MTTLAVYAALGAAMFLLTVQLQQTLGYSALAAGAATVPSIVIMLLASRRWETWPRESGRGYR